MHLRRCPPTECYLRPGPISLHRQRTRLKRRTRVMLEGPTCQTTHVSARASAAVEQRCLLHVHPVPPICLLLVLGRDFGSYARTSANMHWSCALGGLFSWFEGASAAAKLALFRSNTYKMACPHAYSLVQQVVALTRECAIPGTLASLAPA